MTDSGIASNDSSPCQKTRNEMYFLHYAAIVGLIVVLITKYKYEICQKISQKVIESNTLPKVELVVGVLSARDHFEARQAIRDTWMRSIMENAHLSNRIQVQFVVGETGCDIHPDSRISKYGCEKWIVSIPDQTDDVNMVQVQEDSNYSSLMMVDKISFMVRHPVVINKLGLLASISLEHGPVHVLLHDDYREENITEVKFSAQNEGVVDRGYRYMSVQPFLLPKDFEGTIRIIYHDSTEILTAESNGGQHSSTMSDLGGIITVQKHRNPKKERKLFLPSFTMSILEKEQLSTYVKKEISLAQEWTLKEKKIAEDLQREMEMFGDILLVNVTDVYRNLPTKLLYFHQRIFSSFKADFVLKTDDDCFIDLEQIYSFLQKNKEIQNSKLWWGSFRDDWYVEHYGKWAEREYFSSVYPRFACGSGNVVSRDLHHWIAQNYQHLKTYQGEDVSLGIWLAAIGPTFLHDTLWKCDRSCESNMYSIPELLPIELRAMWKNRQTCGNPCSCL
ncbi:hypothetical protein CHS0354_003122 [Potamilus streckersoni]|uniref:Hexosyltransferase n=1 Tax=Potamilus streckersoni TaxID=2493646 RepID=A0AAE0RP56_9BIVA|nr:hypothetical protein CHS0354_003122 [Potamilus streckersoni]